MTYDTSFITPAPYTIDIERENHKLLSSAILVTQAAVRGIRTQAQGKSLDSPDVRGKLKALHDCTYAFTVINGAGGSGKSTFVDMCRMTRYKDAISPIVFEDSSIDPVRNCSEQLLAKYYQGKTDKYRTLLADIKKAWIKFDPDGPTNYLINGIQKTISEKWIFNQFMQFAEIWGISDYPEGDKFLREVNLNPTLTLPRFHYFVHIRELSEITKFIIRAKHLYPHALINTLIVTGRADPKKYANRSDREVESDSFHYDMALINDSTLPALEVAAKRFITYMDNRISANIVNWMNAW